MTYTTNRETGKIELVFPKEEYQALSEAQKSEIKSAFLFSRRIGGWVSRAKFPNLWRAEQVCKAIGAENGGKVGESLTFAEQMERKAERAEARAERMEEHAEAAAKRGNALQKPINDMRGDIAFFTQPNISSSAGRAFTNQRARMFAAFDKGMAEFKKSEYFSARAAAARATADETKPTDKAFCERRIRDAEKTVRKQKENIEHYKSRLEKLEQGEKLTYYNGTEWNAPLTAEIVNSWIEEAEEIIEQAISKAAYYQECLDNLGGIQFSRDNVKPGYIVQIVKYGPVTVVSCGPKNFKYESGVFELSASYGEILKIIKAEEKKESVHPFAVGDEFSVPLWDGNRYVNTVCRIIKRSDKSVTIQDANGKKYVRKPRLLKGACYENGATWCVSVDNNSYRSNYYKPV